MRTNISDQCKLYTGHIASVSPRNAPAITFLSLPLEIRDAIYKLALVSMSPIIVWKGNLKIETIFEVPENRHKTDGACLGPDLTTTIKWRDVDEEATRASLQGLAIGLLFCNKAVGHGAARMFYAHNTFSFLGQHNWDPIVAWLEAIGPTNRNLLSTIEISAGRPDCGWQCSSGRRRRDPGEHGQEEIYPRHPCLQLRTSDGRAKYGWVDNINPAIEKIFVLLGLREANQKPLQIVMQLPDSCYPGVRTPRMPDDTEPHRGYYSMDLPNLVEKFRCLHTAHVEVDWKGQDCRKELEDQREILQNFGWEVRLLPATEDVLHPHPEWHGCHPVTDEWRFANYVLRRKELTGPLWAQDPCLFGSVDPDISPQFC